MMTEPKRLQRTLASFYRKLDRIGIEIRLDRANQHVAKAVDRLRDTLSRGDPNPRAWRSLMVAFLAGRSLGLMAERATIKKMILDKNVPAMTDQERIDFASEMEKVGQRAGL